MKRINLLLILCFILGSCSFSSSNKEEVTSRPSDELEFAVDTLEPSTNIAVEEQKVVEEKYPDEISPVEKSAEVEVKPEEMKMVSNEGKEAPLIIPEEPKFEEYQKAPLIVPEAKVDMAQMESYKVQKGDTYMNIAFKIYGDYRKWKDLKVWNKNKVLGSGAVLKYYVPEKAFSWEPSGLPYLVKTGDTLGIISMDKYGTSKKWKSIYENNRPLIRNPNLIFAGFTLYYMPSRDVASKKE